MSVEENKTIIRRFEDKVWNQRNLSIVDQLFSPNHAFHSPGSPPLDREGHKQMIGHFQSAFPDGKNDTDEMVAEGDRVVQRWTYRGTHQGEFQGIPPTHKQVTLTGISIWRFEAGKIVESWHQLDALGMLQQLGVFPRSGAN